MSTPSSKPKRGGTPKPAGGATESIKVVPKRAGFRRAGFAFPEEGLSIPLASITEEQLQQLETEPMLVTQRLNGEASSVAESLSEGPASE